MPVLAIRYLARNEPSFFHARTRKTAMIKTPNYKQDKRRREDAQKKRNAEEQARQQERKKGVPADPSQA
jgi:hypothetical protein